MLRCELGKSIALEGGDATGVELMKSNKGSQKDDLFKGDSLIRKIGEGNRNRGKCYVRVTSTAPNWPNVTNQ